MYENTFPALKGPSLKAPCNPGCLASLAAPQLGDAGPLVSKHLSGGQQPLDVLGRERSLSMEGSHCRDLGA